MPCDPCRTPTEERFNKMMLCSPCRDRVKAHRSAVREDRQKNAPPARLQGRKLAAAQGPAKKAKAV